MRVWSKRLKLYLTLLIVLWPFAGVAWEEPSEFRGVKFGEDLRKTIPACPSSSLSGTKERLYLPWKTQKRCWEPSAYKPTGGATYYQLHNFGPIGDIAVTMSAAQLTHKLVLVDLTFSSDSFNQLLKTFVARYGEPSEQTTEVLGNAFGATFPSQRVVWYGSYVNIYMRSRSSTIDKGMVIISTEIWRDHLRKQEIDRVKKGRDDL